MIAPVEVGEVVAGKYEIQRVLAAGSMGVVVKAKHLHLGRNVALKFMLVQQAGGRLIPEAVERFKRESRAAARLRGENIAQVLDVGALEDGTPYIVMEYLEGGDLRAYLDEEGALPVPEAVGLVLQACVAMAEAHSCGILHRDLKPENLFLTRRPDGRPLVKVLDFGISKLFASDEPAKGAVQTQITQVMGSPFYMSPEQVRSTRDVDVRADIWSLGVILYELVCGKMPYDHRGTTMDLLARILSEEPRPLATVASLLPAQLCAVADRCLKKNPNQRFQNIGELAIALEPFADPADRPAVASVCATLGMTKGDPSLARTDPDLGAGSVSDRSLLSRLAGAGAEARGFATHKLDNLDASALVPLDGADAEVDLHGERERAAPTVPKGIPTRRKPEGRAAKIKRLSTAPTEELSAITDDSESDGGDGGDVPLAARSTLPAGAPDAAESRPALNVTEDVTEEPVAELQPPAPEESQPPSPAAQSADDDAPIGTAVGVFAEDPHAPDRQHLPPPASATRKTMAEEEPSRPRITAKQLVYIALTCVFAGITAMLVFDAGGTAVLDPLNFLIYRIGFTATRSANTTLHMLAGTLLQLLLPLVLIFFTSWFFSRFLTVALVWWLGQSLFFTARYVADAPHGQLEPIAGDISGFTYILDRWQLMDVAADIANGAHWIGISVMVAALLAMMWRCYRPYEVFV